MNWRNNLINATVVWTFGKSRIKESGNKCIFIWGFLKDRELNLVC